MSKTSAYPGVCVCTYLCTVQIYVCVYTYLYVYIICVYIHILTYIYRYMYMYINKCIHQRIHTQLHSLTCSEALRLLAARKPKMSANNRICVHRFMYTYTDINQFGIWVYIHFM